MIPRSDFHVHSLHVGVQEPETSYLRDLAKMKGAVADIHPGSEALDHLVAAKFDSNYMISSDYGFKKGELN